MKRTSIRRALLPGVTAAVLALSACSAGNSSDSDSGTDTSGSSDSSGGSSDAATDLSGQLNGGGSSAQTTAQQTWTAGFQTSNSGATINYDPVGSGTGRTNFISGAYSFAGSDSALSADVAEGATASEIDQAKEACGGTDAIEVPAYVSPIAVVYNLPDVSDIQLDAATISAIFDGKITKWNDDAIAAQNDGVDLPDTTITPVHRSDDSGTTSNFTDYLEKASDGAWPYPHDGVWPTSGGESAEGTSGLVGAVKAGEGTIGYADESQAGGLGIAKIKVGDSYNAPSAKGAAQVLAESDRSEGRSDVDFAYDVNRTATGDGDYPVFLTSYLIACQTYDDANTAALVKGYLTYALSDEGQQAAAEQAGSAPIDSTLSSEATAVIAKIK